jgi:hypothetical protein
MLNSNRFRSRRLAVSAAALGSATALSSTASAAIVWSGVLDQTLANGFPAFTFTGMPTSAGTPGIRVAIFGKEDHIALQDLFTVASSTSSQFALPLSAGSHIGPSATFNDAQSLGSLKFIYTEFNLANSWFNGQRAFVGIQTVDGSDAHFGWLDATYDNETLTVHSWAYESTPNTPISAGAIPEPSVTALITAGILLAFVFFRRRRS